MKKTYWKYIMCAALVLLSACSEEEVLSPTYTVGKADNAITLSAGISEGGSGVQTRAAYGTTEYTDFTANTGLKLYIEGTWIGHEPVQVIKYPVATINGAADSQHKSAVKFSASEQPYWDDYGTADPGNMPDVDGNGRTKGLTIYAAAINGVNTAPTIADNGWGSLLWTLDADQQTNDWKNKDLLISNNVTTDGTYKFNDRASGKLLVFTHIMSKITVNFIAGEGFSGYETNPENAKFAGALSVVLKGFYYTGSINVKTKEFTENTSTRDVTPRMDNSGANSHTAQFTALVFPQQVMAADQAILEFTADGNKYYVNANKLRTAMSNTTGHNTDYKLEKGVNYILNITVNKTSIDVSATIKSWEDVSAANDTPIIGFSKCYGQTTGNELTDFQRGFTFYRSTALTGSYLETGNSATVVYSTGYTMTPQLYWPDHNTHYFFRGVYPEVGSVDSNQDAIGPATTKLKPNSIEVTNAPYKANYYPSDLMIGMPRTATGDRDENCKAGHTQADGTTPMGGICATDAVAGSSHENEGLIHMNFEYAMCQVIVKLETTSDPHNSVAFNQYTKVYIVDGYEAGEIKLSDGSSDFTGKTVANFQMDNDNNITNRETNNYANYRNAIIPQKLTNGTGTDAKNLKFRVIVGDGSQEDSYETVNGIKEIEVSEDGGVTKHKIDEWKPGKRYTYTLTITKTGIEVIATIKDWTDVDASENIWF